jgi:hypothetical protein
VRLIQAVLIPSYLPLLAEKQVTIVLCLLCYVAGCVHKMVKPDMSMEPKITCFIFQPILEFQKHFYYTDANAVKALNCSVTAQFAKYVVSNLARKAK